MNPFFRHFGDAFRHRHHHHFNRRGFAGFAGRHGYSDGPSGVGFDRLNRGRKLGAADLQLLLLALLAERPSHGYELIKALDDRSKGYYVPSPGMVYPALTYLEEIGLATVESQGAKKLYRITDTGRVHLEGQRAQVDALLQQLSYIGQRMDELRRAMAAGADDEAGPDGSPDGFFGRPGRGRRGGPEISAARRNLKSALIEKTGADAAEERRIAAILERAADEIRAAPSRG